MIHSDIIFASLDLLRLILMHDALGPTSTHVHPKFLIYATAIRQVVDAEGLQLTGYLMAGLIGEFPEESSSAVVSIFRALAAQWPSQLLTWLPQVSDQLPATAAYISAKTQFLDDVTRSVLFGACICQAKIYYLLFD